MRGDMREPDVTIQPAEKRHAVPDEDGHARHDQALDQSGAQELLDGDAAIDVQVRETSAASCDTMSPASPTCVRRRRRPGRRAVACY